MIYDNIVIGSGISALGCILGLLKSKKKILCIDGSDFSNLERNKNDNEKIVYCSQKLPLKNFKFEKKSKRYFSPIEVLESKSFGGLSNVWGANTLRFLKNDLKKWPISYEDLKNYYDECEEVMNVSHYDDEISEELKINNNKYDESKLKLYSNFIKKFFNKNKSSNNNFISGFSRIALNPNATNCSGCFFGCDHVFNTKEILKKLINNKDIDYKENLILKKFILKDNLIELEFTNSINEKILTKKLFIGAGSIQTPKIVINSLNDKKDLIIKESQPFYIPCIYLGRNFNNNTQHHTLTQAHAYFKKNITYDIGKIHHEIKYDTKVIKLSLKKQFGFLHKFIPDILIKRIFVITGFINRDNSDYMGKIRKQDLRIDILENKKNKKKISTEVMNQLKILGKNFNFIAIKFFLKLGNFGRGFHIGGSIPMMDENKMNQNSQNDLYTKKNGEINKFTNVYIVDSTNFTNIPAGSVSLTIMANALRIGTESNND